MGTAIVDKGALRERLLEALRASRETVAAAQRTTQQGVTHEDARAEGDKDMRATEASYVARGQAMRVEALDGDIGRVVSMQLRSFTEDEPVALSAVVTLENDSGERRVFLAPAGGGERLQAGGISVSVVTPSSPLGRALVGAHAGDSIRYRRGDTEDEVEIVEIL
jgi:transcription elongation GreA/GreB family factor